ncbi:MAG: PTS glucose transporter subunit IIA [Oscillospiraceae bacterium]|nr:PTS glucose transporter subunit IIA [Oscillospiraceae bacterium]
MFGFGKKSNITTIASPMNGTVIPLSEINDPVFSQGILGPGIAIKPESGCVLAPCNAVIEQMFETGHAVSLLTDDGLQLLIHVGIDTVKLKGMYYTIVKNSGEKVNKGEVLMEFDAAAISAEGFDTVTPVVVCNPDDFGKLSFAKEGTVKAGDMLITARKGGS